ncbi:MotE family protein [Mesorhizobium sp. BAC0120]|uniref:MotE family protein n=1 Tax=Mesorhizobium sp. BAC0120 TaxID=3090670 RepID=UPI00298D4C8F|nr:MotE family protein [Mesorhizobium sp. BAC0120]MDW6024440.1 MotE family protein [Mesorhizobium sp. BAC0120]
MRGLQGAAIPEHAPVRRALYAAIGIAAVLFAAGPARTAQGEPVQAAAPTDSSTEVERFCSNIADAARDRRYALQAKELEKLKSDIDERIKALEAKRLEYEQWLKRRDDFLALAQDNVVKIYAKMKPDAAAERLSETRIDVAAGILMKLDARQASTILNEMDRKAAATITGIMVSATRKEDPS